MTIKNERELVVLVQENLPYDTRHFQQLIGPYLPKLKGYCSQLLKNNADAEDVVQETIIKVLSHLKNFKWTVSFQAWLFKIAHNECINKLRERQKDFYRDEEKLEEPSVSIDNGNDDFEQIIQDLIETLNFTDRNIMLLRYRTGLEFQEIADISDMKLSAVKMRHKRIIDALSEQLAEQ
ncbi:RNA polymerase sigma factor SigX [Endozoicomonas sp. G2_1]|uniref:RNA polymerase sigma factor SigX n=1 Tax=Endozoicomonas sp. G2_1 TaxID=2821091 RepID=UPI001AD9F085|nr:RNA polymerase sigma factor SigX [Endozoicomonas sp. G2_1]MBO9489555.1 RNA polymerase sigma factor SigX [Endozoicomonas sp. G2_1]